MHTVKGGDMNNDGFVDIVVGRPWADGGSDREVLVWYNDGTGDFGSPQMVTTGRGLYSGVLVDLGNDNDLDIVGQNIYAGRSRPYIYENECF